MSGLVEPIYVGTINGKPLRFFKAPLPGPHLVWHAFDDLVLCLDLPRDLRRSFQQGLKSSEWASDVHTVATDGGIVTIAPHWIAQGMIGSMMELGRTSTKTEFAYAVEAMAAWNAMNGDLPPMASLDLMIAAFRNTNRIEGGAR